MFYLHDRGNRSLATRKNTAISAMVEKDLLYVPLASRSEPLPDRGIILLRGAPLSTSFFWILVLTVVVSWLFLDTRVSVFGA